MNKKLILTVFCNIILSHKPLFADITVAQPAHMRTLNDVSLSLATNFPFKTKGKFSSLRKRASRINLQAKAVAEKAQTATLNFAEQNINTSSPAKTFTIRGSNLTGAVTVSATSPFYISKDSIVYKTSLGYSVEEMATNKKIYVKFNPTIAGNYTGSISNLSEGADSKILTLTGTAIDPNSMININQIVVSNLVTPNGDGKNDYWVIKNIDYYPNNTVKVFDKTGRMVYSKQGYTNDWNGTYNNAPLSQGTYFYIIEFGAGLGVNKGYITIVRD